MAIKTLPYDPARHLTSPEAQAELLSDAMQTGDAGYIANALGVIARARHDRSGAWRRHYTRSALSSAE